MANTNTWTSIWESHHIKDLLFIYKFFKNLIWSRGTSQEPCNEVCVHPWGRRWSDLIRGHSWRVKCCEVPQSHPLVLKWSSVCVEEDLQMSYSAWSMICMENKFTDLMPPSPQSGGTLNAGARWWFSLFLWFLTVPSRSERDLSFTSWLCFSSHTLLQWSTSCDDV